MSPAGAIAFFVLLALLLVGGLFGPTWAVALRRGRVVRQAFPGSWRAVLRQRMPAYARLPPDVQRRLRERIQVMLAEVPFIGCAGFTITDEVRVLIAAQAALLLLQRGPAFRGLREVLVYPGHFVVEHAREGVGGVVHESRRVLAGESWPRGQVVLAWDSVVEGAADPDDGQNVVIHEFAHQIDHEKGRANGAPFLAADGSGVTRRRNQQRWAEVLGREFARLRQQIAAGEAPLIGAYAATDPAEFFAVVSELFYEKPHELAAAHPALFDEFARCYRVDPRTW